MKLIDIILESDKQEAANRKRGEIVLDYLRNGQFTYDGKTDVYDPKMAGEYKYKVKHASVHGFSSGSTVIIGNSDSKPFEIYKKNDKGAYKLVRGENYYTAYVLTKIHFKNNLKKFNVGLF